MRLTDRYLGAIYDRALSRPGGEVSPSVMCQACVDVLPVDGAGISLAHQALRVPLGWSSGSIGTAERLQTTLGAGPCLDAVGTGSALAANAAAIAERWPVYWDELVRLTPFRSVASVPLRVGQEPAFGALNLFASSDDLCSALDLQDVADAVAGPVARMLSGVFDRLYDDEPDVPDWLCDDPAVERITVWTAVGMLVAAGAANDGDALATLRSWAYGRGRSLDDVATSLVDGVTPVELLLADV